MLIQGVLLSLLLAFQAQAEIQKIQVGNQSVEVSAVEYRTDANGARIVHSAQLIQPTTIIFARGNELLLSGRLVLHDNGAVWMAEAPELKSLMRWKLPQGRMLSLYCGQPAMVNGELAPVKYLVFYENGEYGSGCHSVANVEFAAKYGVIGVKASSEIDLDASGSLKYARQITSGEMELFGQKVRLEKDSEVDFHENGKPHFFKLAPGESLRVPVDGLGEVLIQQQPTHRTSTQFNQNGQLETALLGGSLMVGSVVVPAGSLISFEKLQVSDSPQREFTVIFSTEQPVTVGEKAYWVSQVHFDSENRVTGISITRSFEFDSPEGDHIHVPERSKVYFLPSGKIIRIDISY